MYRGHLPDCMVSVSPGQGLVALPEEVPHRPSPSSAGDTIQYNRVEFIPIRGGGVGLFIERLQVWSLNVLRLPVVILEQGALMTCLLPTVQALPAP